MAFPLESPADKTKGAVGKGRQRTKAMRGYGSVIHIGRLNCNLRCSSHKACQRGTKDLSRLIKGGTLLGIVTEEAAQKTSVGRETFDCSIVGVPVMGRMLRKRILS